MNKVALISAAGAGGLLLFSAAYIGFAKMNGAPLHELPVFGSLFPKPEAKPEAGDDKSGDAAKNGDAKATDEHASAAKPDEKGESHVASGDEKKTFKLPKKSERTADLMSAFQLQSPYTSDELRELVENLKNKNVELDKRLADVTAREDIVNERIDVLEERQKSLDKLKSELEAQRKELDARTEELNHDEKTSKEVDEKSTKSLSTLFEDGDAEQLATRLVSYGPKEAAKILASLPPDRAKELLDAVPQAKWREFAEAYTRASVGAKPKDK